MDLALTGICRGVGRRSRIRSNDLRICFCDSGGRVAGPFRTRIPVRSVRGRVDVATGAVIPSGGTLIDERSSARHSVGLQVVGWIHVMGHQLSRGGKASLCGGAPVDELRKVKITPSTCEDLRNKVERTLSLPSELRSFGGVSGG
jgi:hypothetical protein